MRRLIVLGLVAGLAGPAALPAPPAGAKVPGPNGRIAFARFVPALGATATFTVNPDGTEVRQLFARGSRSSDGGGLTRITSNPGGDDIPGDYSPDGKRLVFARTDQDGRVGIFAARAAADHRLVIWVVGADGSGLHQLPIEPACGGAFSDPRSTSCFQPGWSPDGTKIVFTRIGANGTQENVYTVNADGSDLFRVTSGGRAEQPDWGPRA
jgi:TolB protein